MDENKQYVRYQRQTLLKELGLEGQQKLLNSKVLVIGAGGLGCPALQYLAAAGIGTIGIVDDDVVSLNNLHRQILYCTADVGQPKATIAAKVLQALNPDISINSYGIRLTNRNALLLFEQYDIILDGTDNFETRYLINDACVLLGKPLVYAAISKFEGQVAIFNCIRNEQSPVNYRDLFPGLPAEGEIMNCEEAGVLGILPGIIGCMQANETIKLIGGFGTPLINKLLTYNALNNEVYELDLTPSTKTNNDVPKTYEEFENYNYKWACKLDHTLEIDENNLYDLVGKSNVAVIDVREPDEVPSLDKIPHLKMPISKVDFTKLEVDGDTIITICQSGKRSLQVAKMLHQKYGNQKQVFSLKGGINNLKKSL